MTYRTLDNNPQNRTSYAHYPVLRKLTYAVFLAWRIDVSDAMARP